MSDENYYWQEMREHVQTMNTALADTARKARFAGTMAGIIVKALVDPDPGAHPEAPMVKYNPAKLFKSSQAPAPQPVQQDQSPEGERNPMDFFKATTPLPRAEITRSVRSRKAGRENDGQGRG